MESQLPASARMNVSRALLDEAVTLTDAIRALENARPDHPALVFVDRAGREETITLGALLARADRIRSGLVNRGLRAGDHVVLILPTSAELAAAYCGVMFAGAVPALAATPHQRAAEPSTYRRMIAGILANGPARLVYADAATVSVLSSVDEPAPGSAMLLCPGDLSDEGPVGSAVVAQPGDLATIQYSSGSTGAPKGIRLSHRAMLNNIRAVRDGLGLTSEDVSVNWIPLYHDMGLIDAFLLPLLCGCRTVLIPTTDFIREPRVWLEALHRYRGTISWAPNFAYALCVQRVHERDLAGLDLSRWRYAINAAEPVLACTIDAFTRRFAPYGFRPAAMTAAWGLAENVTIATADLPGRAPRVEILDRAVLASEGRARPIEGAGLESVAIGRCLPGCAIEIRQGGRVLGDREVGEIWLRSDSLFDGYHRDPELTASALHAGWLNTGDRGYLCDGDLFFVARGKDVIVIAGEKYAPHDIETAINQVPGVRQGCAVAFGILDPERGTEGVAAVVETRVSEPADAEALARAIRSHVTRTTGLALVRLKLVAPNGIQKTTSGKLARRATRERYAEEMEIPA